MTSGQILNDTLGSLMARIGSSTLRRSLQEVPRTVTTTPGGGTNSRTTCRSAAYIHPSIDDFEQDDMSMEEEDEEDQFL